MSAIYAWRHNALLMCIGTLLWLESSLGQSVNFEVGDVNASVSVATGRFTPTQYVPAFSSLVVTLAGSNVFPGDALSIGTSVSVSGQSGNNLRFEIFRDVGFAWGSSEFETTLINNDAYKNNNPSSIGWTSGISIAQSSPSIDFFGQRVTGAFCPTISGQYGFQLTLVDDYVSLHIAREDPNSPGSILPFEAVIKKIYGDQMPFSENYHMQANKMYPLIVLLADRDVLDGATFNWRKPGDADYSSIPSSAFCTGWSNFHGGKLTIFFPFFLLPNAQVTFTIQTLPNPSCPRSASAQISSAIVVRAYTGIMNSVSGTVQSSTAGSFPSTIHGQNSCKPGVVLSVSDISAATSEVVGRFTPTQYIPAFSSLVVTLAAANVFPTGVSAARAHVSASPAQTGNNNIRVEKFILKDAFPFRDKMINDPNFQSNNPHRTSFASEITLVQTNPNEEHFVLRWTGAFCPTTTGNYEFALFDVDDFFELHVGGHGSASFTQVMSQIGGETDFPSASRPLRRTVSMEAGKMYPFIAMYVEAAVHDYLSLKWKVPGAATDAAIPPNAFCTGWSYFNNSVLTIFSPFAMLPGVEVAFTIPSLPNPLCPRPVGTQVSSAISVPQISIMNSASSSIESSSSGAYPDRAVPSSSLAITWGKIGSAKVLNISFTSPLWLEPPFAFTITFTGQSFAFSGQSVVFISPAGSTATAAVSQSPLVLTVQVQRIDATSGGETTPGTFQSRIAINYVIPAHAPVIFTFGNVTNSLPQDRVFGIPSSILGSNGRCLAASSSGVIAAVPRSRWAFICGAASNGWSCEE
jgi:hypothetical protein